MMLTTKSRYAVMAIVDVAERNRKSPIRLADIARSQNISLDYLEQIFFKLKKAKLVSAVKGPGGGYRLSLPLHDIFVEDIVDAVNENLTMTRCSKDKTCRQQGKNCKTHNLWKGLGRHIREYFATISIADIVANNIDITCYAEK